MESLGEIALRVSQCSDCSLHRSRTKSVPGEGNNSAEIMLIGEGPGAREDQEGRPFVGPAGQFLEQLLDSIDLNRLDVFIANMVKCRPPNNRDPFPEELQACSKYLEKQIELVNPLLIVTLGRFSLARFFPGETMGMARGKLRQYKKRYIFPIMHPAAALYRPQNKITIMDDFGVIPEILSTLRNTSDINVVSPVEELSPPEQLSLF